MMKEYHTNHSFTKPPACTQIITYILLISQMLVFTLCLQGNIENSPAKIILIIIFSITYTGAVVAGCVTSCSDTTDPLLRKNSDDLNIEFKEHLYCHICHSKVQIKTRHCKVCNLCINGFDHHCIWINNCIGKHNYKSFIVMLVFTVTNFVIFHISLLLLWMEKQWNNFILSMIINWAFGLILLVFTILLLVLFAFHIYLITTNQTTLQFYISQKKIVEVKPQKVQQQQCLQETSQHQNINQKTHETIIFKKQSSVLIAFDSKQNFNHTQYESPAVKQNKNSIEKSKIQNKESLKDQQIKQNGKKEESQQDTIHETVLIRRSKSMQYVLGKTLIHTPIKMETSKYQTEKRSKPQLKIQKECPH